MDKLPKFILLAITASILVGLAVRIFQAASPVTREVIAVVERDGSVTKNLGRIQSTNINRITKYRDQSGEFDREEYMVVIQGERGTGRAMVLIKKSLGEDKTIAPPTVVKLEIVGR